MEQTKLINISEVKKALRVNGLAGAFMANIAMKVAGFDTLNAIYSHISKYNGAEFAEQLIRYLEITVDSESDALANIPDSGPVVFTSNHPFGGLDAMVALYVLHKVRPDIKILSDFLIAKIPNTKDNFIAVNTTFGFGRYLRTDFSGLKKAEEHLLNGGALLMFPAGEVASGKNGEILDSEWNSSLMKMIRRTKSYAVPVYFHGGNSKYFQLLGKISTKLSSLRLPGELNKKKGKVVIMRVGMPVSKVEVAMRDNSNLAGYLRSRTYLLESKIEKVKESAYTVPVAPPVATEKLLADLESNRSSKLFDVDHQSCYLLDYHSAPDMMREIAVRREEAFRAVGEGTNREIDTDEFDLYYKHLVLWDNKTNDLVGAYRLALGAEVFEKHGVRGFYSDTLFHYKDGFTPVLKESIELGRSFVAINHQKDTLALILLLKGLFYTALRYPEYKHLLGPVSISSWYPLLYRSLMIDYLGKNYNIPEYSKYIAPKRPFVPNYGRVDAKALMEGRQSNLETFDRTLYKMSGKYKLPPLVKKYIKMGARIIGFNVDPDFNFCVDGLIMLTLKNIPMDDLDSLSREFDEKGPIYRRFYNM